MFDKFHFPISDAYVATSSRTDQEIYSTTKETHQSLFRAIMAKLLRHENIFYTIFFSNQLCIKLLKNVTVFLKPVHAVRQCIDKVSFLKMTGFRQMVFTRVLA